jgi:hypothetical protein
MNLIFFVFVGIKLNKVTRYAAATTAYSKMPLQKKKLKKNATAKR